MRVDTNQSLLSVSTARAAGANTRIIIADGDFTRRLEMVRYFESFSMNATSVSGWLELRRCLMQPGAYLVILDLELLREGGLDLLREIRSLFHAPVILIGGPRRG
ncbi:hypothetical protein [Bradyrhizobium sp. B117]|uniref:hypothetical protein n=1 Tax=Bradyrhizobium sp. B117 TaxID=3140246 RepID=UPI0031832AD2